VIDPHETDEKEMGTLKKHQQAEVAIAFLASSSLRDELGIPCRKPLIVLKMVFMPSR